VKRRRSSEDADIDPRLAALARAFEDDPRVELLRRMSSFTLCVSKKIFVMLVRGSLVAKLPSDRVTALVDAGKGERFDPRGDGRVMREWIVLNDEAPPWRTIAKEAHRFVSGSAGAG
jgi:hypothetical protein